MPVVVRQRGAVVVVDVPLPAALAQAVPESGLPSPVGLALALGTDDAGRPVMLDLGSPGTPHALVCGATGAGKSNALGVILAQLARSGAARVVLVDPDGRTFPGLPVAVDPVDVRQACAWVSGEVSRRAAGRGGPPVVMLADEGQAIARDGANRAALETIAARGRKHGVHLVLAASDAAGASLPRSVVVNLRARLSGAVADHHASMAALGRAGAERLRGPGRMVLEPAGVVVDVALADPNPTRAAGVVVQPWAVPETVPGPSPTVPPEVRAWVEDELGTGGRMPGIGRIAARFKVGKRRAAGWLEALGDGGGVHVPALGGEA